MRTPKEAIDLASFDSFSSASTVKLLIGEDEQEVIAYGSYLVRDSQFFAAAMKKEWVEGKTREIKLPEEHTATVSHYLFYVYSGKLFTEDIMRVDGDTIGPCFQLLCSLFVSGERFMNRRLQNDLVKEILRLTCLPDRQRLHWYPTGEDVNIIYRGTPQGSPGRRLMVDLHVIMGTKDWMVSGLENDFVIDVAKALYDKVQNLDFREIELSTQRYQI